MEEEPGGLKLKSAPYGYGDLSLNAEIMFSNHKGVHKKGIEKRQTKFTEKLDALPHFLEEGEQILLITTACSPTSFWEQLTIGWIFLYLKRSLLVFTDRRIFHIPTTMEFGWRYTIAEIRYADCESIKVKGRKIIFRYKNGKKEGFYYVAKKEARKLKSFMPTIPLTGEQSAAQGRVHLCPRCTAPLESDVYTCGNCSLEFKNKKEAMRLSVRYPGGGYFYTGHPVLGVSDAIAEIWLLVLLVLSAIEAANGLRGGVLGVCIFGVALVIEKLMTISLNFVTEYLPVDKVVDPQRQPADSGLQ